MDYLRSLFVFYAPSASLAIKILHFPFPWHLLIGFPRAAMPPATASAAWRPLLRGAGAPDPVPSLHNLFYFPNDVIVPIHPEELNRCAPIWVGLNEPRIIQRAPLFLGVSAPRLGNQFLRMSCLAAIKFCEPWINLWHFDGLCNLYWIEFHCGSDGALSLLRCCYSYL